MVEPFTPSVRLYPRLIQEATPLSMTENMKDIGFHFMMDPSFPPDTLFIVAEADFRFYEADDMTPLEWAGVVRSYEEAISVATPKSKPASSQNPPSAPVAPFPRPASTSTGSCFVPAQRPSRESSFPQEIQDTVTVCNAADRPRFIGLGKGVLNILMFKRLCAYWPFRQVYGH